ncbi:hypothetical protein CSA56_03575 [candidate division KSB3 bacterium]|uniref:Diguanylate cyclase n=1 Tax=candidate division KSB3 bacterium TaxID=2044937 RepID=A0A2G6KKK8_9BACT|nr:MAG: hypothetical protein CSA56_03575 [candidate division KSB3 bacterium]
MKKETILIVDDSPTNLHVLLDYLGEVGFNVLIAQNGEDALQQLETVVPDLILLDVMMPGIDGFEVCRRIKGNTRTQNISIIFMTALSHPEDKIKGFEAGGIDYLTKPLHHQEVIARLNTHLENQKLQEQLKAQNLRLEQQNLLLEEKNEQLHREIAERKRTEDVLTESMKQVELAKQEWESTADSLVHVICLLDRQGQIIRSNRTVEQWQLGEVLNVKGKTIHELLHPQCSEPSCYLRIFLHDSKKALVHNRSYEYEGEDPILRRHLDIQIRPISVNTARAVHPPSSTSFAVCVIQDVTSRKHVERDLKQRTQELLLLNTLSDSLQRCQTEKETYAVVINVCRQLFPLTSGTLRIVNQSQQTLYEAAFWGNPPGKIRTLDIDEAWNFDREQSPIIPSFNANSLPRDINCSADSHCQSFPVRISGEILAILSIDFTQCSKQHTEQECQRIFESRHLVITGVVEHYALALVNLRLRETLQRESMIDPLTGLFNRRHMEASLSREARRAQRHNTSLGIMMLDVDHFKVFNDTYGHAAGDIVLRELGGLLRRHTRAEDIACRYGGEEFLLILPEASLLDTRQRAEELRIMAKELQIRYQENILSITISLGVAALPRHGINARDIIHAADKALYRAKHQGRDCVVTATFSH